MKIEEIDAFPLRHLVADHCQCQSCRIVDRDPERARVGHPCRVCGVPSEAAHSYFPLGVATLVDLIQHFYHLPTHEGSGSFLVGAEAQRLTVVVLFSSLVEVLLQHFLDVGLMSKGFPRAVVRRRLLQSQPVHARLKHLFPVVAGESWVSALAAVGAAGGRQVAETDLFCRHVAKARNSFLHDGNKWAIPEGMPLECLKSLPPLVELFVSIHNRYVARRNGGGSGPGSG